MALGLLLAVFLPAMVVWLGLALLSWLPLLLCVFLLVLQVVATIVAVVLLPARWEVWLFFLGPGGFVALLRGYAAFLEVRDTRRARHDT